MRSLTTRFALLLAWLALSTLSAQAQGGYPPLPASVNDYANVISPADEEALRQLFAATERDSDLQPVVITINTIAEYGTGDTSIESFATKLFNTRKLGDAQTNKGVLFVVAVKDRKVRIEVGKGFGDDYDAALQTVIDNDLLPAFRENNYSAGLKRGAQTALTALRAPPPSPFAAFRNMLPRILFYGPVVALIAIVGAFITLLLRAAQNRATSTSGQMLSDTSSHWSNSDHNAWGNTSVSSDSSSSSDSSGSSDGGGASGSW